MSISTPPTRRLAQKIPREPPPPYAPPLETTIPPSDATPLLATPPPSPRRSLHRTRSHNATEISHTESELTLHENEGENQTALEAATLQPSLSLSQGTPQYFQPLVQKQYWLAAFHLGVINFPFALVAWVYLFVGTLVGTTLLLLLPFGALIWWMTLIGARAFTRWELKLQDRFHLHQDSVSNTTVPYTHQASLRLQLQSPLLLPSSLEAGLPADGQAPPAYEPSFLQTTYAMFFDPVSYQPLFYFIVIKGATTLLLTPIIIAIVPVSLVLFFPAPFVLRTVRRVGLWQADLAMEGLGCGGLTKKIEIEILRLLTA
ncbi:hypothetical protein FRB97_000438 [Tulasnella sp. 331]|nr:hypothetical protein FRB97_000438 [Tulasnella sp. 331]